MIQQTVSKRKYPSRRYPWTISHAIVRDVWQHLTLNPTASIRAIASATQHSTEAVALALKSLTDLGYIAISANTRGARIIVLPCITAEVHNAE